MILTWKELEGKFLLTKFSTYLYIFFYYRAHRNDMENILPYFTMALLYICTDPNPTIACNLFRVASVARIIHTLVYAFRPVPQPSRFLAFFVMFLITIYMAIVVGFENLKYI